MDNFPELMVAGGVKHGFYERERDLLCDAAMIVGLAFKGEPELTQPDHWSAVGLTSEQYAELVNQERRDYQRQVAEQFPALVAAVYAELVRREQ